LFEKLVERFPTCGRFWRIYIEQEVVKHGTIVSVYNGQSEHALVLISPVIFLHAVMFEVQSVNTIIS